MRKTQEKIPNNNQSQQSNQSLIRNRSANQTQDIQPLNSSMSNNSRNFISMNLSQNSDYSATLLSNIPDILSSIDITSMDQNVIIALFQIVQQQTIALQSLMRKVQYMAKKSIQLNEKINTLKKCQEQSQINGARTVNGRFNMLDESKSNGYQRLSSNVKIQEESIFGLKERCRASGMSQVTDSQKLIQILFGKLQYQYKLHLDQPLNFPLFRERNFEVKIKLTDMQGNQVSNDNKIPLNIAVYTCQNPPKFIETNTGGQKMIKGFTQQTLQNGYCRFEKIQIRQVTSHFRNGWIFIVVIPSMTPLGSFNSSSKAIVDYKKVKPLVLEKVVVKAKKLKNSKENESEEKHEKKTNIKKKVGEVIKQEVNQSQSQFMVEQSQQNVEMKRENKHSRNQNDKFYQQQGES